MIYITGDCHGDYRRFSTQVFPEQKGMSKQDYVIICGDFGLWDRSAEQEYWRKYLDQKPFTTLWVDGNHENYDLLKEYPIQEWQGGKAQFIMPSVLHLLRGQVFDIGGRRFFTFGGAASHDIQGGILEPEDPGFRRKKKRLDRGYLPYRIHHRSWWKEEMPSQEEFEEGRRNLNRVGWQVDFVVTHCCPSDIQAAFSFGNYEPDPLTDYLQEIDASLDFQKHFFGHYHDNRDIMGKYVMLYEQIIRIL
jgi:predicted phosphodiesterase